MKAVLVIAVSFFAVVLANIEQTHETAYPLENAEFPKGKLNSNKAIKNFIKIAEEHKFNISVIVSTTENYKNGRTKQSIALTLNFPATSPILTKSSLTKEVGKSFVKTATDEKLGAKIVHAEKDKVRTWSNNRQEVPRTASHILLNNVRLTDPLPIVEDKNYATQYTFIAPGPDGKNETTRVLYGDLEVEVEEKHHLNDEELANIKSVIARAYFTYNDDEFSRGVIALLNKSIPNEEWQIASNVGEHSYVEAKKSTLLKILGDNYLIFST